MNGIAPYSERSSAAYSPLGKGKKRKIPVQALVSLILLALGLFNLLEIKKLHHLLHNHSTHRTQPTLTLTEGLS